MINTTKNNIDGEVDSNHYYHYNNDYYHHGSENNRIKKKNRLPKVHALWLIDNTSLSFKKWEREF